MIVGSSVLVVLAGQTSWTLAFGGAGALMILIALVNMAVMPRIEDAAPATPVPLTDDPAAGADPGTAAGASKAERVFAAFRSFLSQPRAPVVLAFMFFYKLGDFMMFAMSKPLLRDIGGDTSHRGLLNGLGTFTFILGSVAGGALVARAGIERCLAPMPLFQNLAIPFYVLLAVVKPRFAGIVPVVLFEQFASGIGGAAHVVFLMRRCRAAFSASHYAFATAIVSLGSTLTGYASGPLNEALGHPWFFTVAFIASWPRLELVRIVPKTEVEPSAAAVAVAAAGLDAGALLQRGAVAGSAGAVCLVRVRHAHLVGHAAARHGRIGVAGHRGGRELLIGEETPAHRVVRARARVAPLDDAVTPGLRQITGPRAAAGVAVRAVAAGVTDLVSAAGAQRGRHGQDLQAGAPKRDK